MLQESFIRLQLSLFKPFVSNCSLKTARDGQDKVLTAYDLYAKKAGNN